MSVTLEIETPGTVAGTHLGWLWDDGAQLRTLLAPELRHSLRSHERVVIVAETGFRQRLFDWLAGCDLDLATVVDSWHLFLLDPHDVCLINGEFGPDCSLGYTEGVVETVCANDHERRPEPGAVRAGTGDGLQLLDTATGGG